MAQARFRITSGTAISTEVPETLDISIEEVMKDLDEGWFIHPTRDERAA